MAVHWVCVFLAQSPGKPLLCFQYSQLPIIQVWIFHFMGGPWMVPSTRFPLAPQNTFTSINQDVFWACRRFWKETVLPKPVHSEALCQVLYVIQVIDRITLNSCIRLLVNEEASVYPVLWWWLGGCGGLLLREVFVCTGELSARPNSLWIPVVPSQSRPCLHFLTCLSRKMLGGKVFQIQLLKSLLYIPHNLHMKEK